MAPMTGFPSIVETYLADLRRDERKRLPFMTRLLYLVFSRMSWFRESSRLVRLSAAGP